MKPDSRRAAAVTAAMISLVALGILLLVIKVYADPPPPVLKEAYTPGFDAHGALLRDIRDGIWALRADIRSMGGGQALTPLDLNATAKTRCFECHSADQADERGSGFAMFTKEGRLEEFNSNEVRRIIRKIDKNEMPPPDKGRLSDQEKATFKRLKPKGKVTE